MTITIHAQGAERKRLVQTISDWLGVPAKYCGAPTFNYEVDYFTIDRNGSLSFDDRDCGFGIAEVGRTHLGVLVCETTARHHTAKHAS